MSETGRKIKVLFLCTGNSCRSQMAEGWTRHLKGDEIEAFSAGVDPHGVDPRAVQVMAEVGGDISDQTSIHVDELSDREFDYVVTVCDSAREACPAFSGAGTMVHKSFEDPPRLAADAEDVEEALESYRRVRDEIREFIEEMPANLKRLNKEGR